MKPLLQLLLSPGSITILVIGALAFALLALLRPRSVATWTVAFRGNVHASFDGQRVGLRCRSASLGIDHEVAGADGHCVLAEGKPGEPLAPAGTLSIEWPASDGTPARVAVVDLARLLERPLMGCVELLVDRDAVVARALAYTWGGSPSSGTARPHRRTRTLNELRIPFTTPGV